MAIEIALAACAVVLMVPAVVLFVQSVGAVLSTRATTQTAPTAHERRPTVAVLVAAHNETTHLPATLTAINAQLTDGDRVVVVADNCTDDTAAVAASMNAEVTERFDAARRGKGYAIDHGVRYLAGNPPEVVVVVDADCDLHPGSLHTLACRCAELGRPVQALYLMLARPGAVLGCRLSELGWSSKNHVRPLGMSALGAPCQLMGSGMALPWSTIARASLADASIVEDLRLGLELAQLGQAPRFCPEALVTSYFPSGPQARRTQNTRWEHGHLATIVGLAPRLMWRCLVDRNRDLAAMVLDLVVPPVAWLVLAFSAIAALAAASRLVGAASWLIVMPLVGLHLVAGAVGLSWWRFGRGSVSLAELLIAPIYAVAKVPMYSRFLWARQTEWLRAERDPDGD